MEFPENSRLFMTGGTGFFGKCLLRAIAELNEKQQLKCEVVVLSRDPASFKRKFPDLAGFSWLSFVEGDIETFAWVDGQHFTHMIHAATDTSAKAIDNPLWWFNQIVGGTKQALEFARVSGVNKFLLTSSGAVYGPQPANMNSMPETFLGAPDVADINSVYGVAKRAAEQLCTIYFHQFGIEAKIARCFAFVDEYLPLDAHFAIGNFIRDALYSDAIRVKGDGSPLRSYLYGEDLAVWLLTILEKGKAAYPYNVGSDEAVSIRELAHIVRDTIAPGKPVKIEEQRPDYVGRSRYIPDVTRARTELNLAASTKLESALRRTVRSLRVVNVA